MHLQIQRTVPGLEINLKKGIHLQKGIGDIVLIYEKFIAIENFLH